MRSEDVEKEWLDHLVTGRKTVEGRKASPRWITVKVGETIELTCKAEPDRKEYFKVRSVRYYKDLTEYLETEGYDNCLPDIGSLEAAMEKYKEWSKEGELKKYGFMGIALTYLGNKL